MPSFDAPKSGDAITMSGSGTLVVPDHPILPFIEGDGTGPDIWRASQAVLDAAVAKAYGGKKKIAWYEVYAGEKSKKLFDDWLPEGTVEAYRKYLVGIKGPLTTPVGKGIRSLNVTLRQQLDLYVCLRPVRWFQGVPSPVKSPGDVDMVIFRENTEDIYAGIEWEAESAEAKKIVAFLQNEMKVKKIRFPETSGIGIKPVSREGTERLVRAAIDYALRFNRKSVTLFRSNRSAYSMAARTSRSVPSRLTGLMPMPLVSGKRIFFTPISFCRNEIIFSASGVSAAHSMPA